MDAARDRRRCSDVDIDHRRRNGQRGHGKGNESRDLELHLGLWEFVSKYGEDSGRLQTRIRSD